MQRNIESANKVRAKVAQQIYATNTKRFEDLTLKNLERKCNQDQALSQLEDFVTQRSLVAEEKEKKIVESIRDTTSKIKDVRTFPKAKNVVLGYLDKRVSLAPRFSPRS